ncbi:hypothetical protein [Aliivibrio fischeri]|uniref:hypothetical protein n=1 Tax=Aliivibrio fischeri TaxID=668 RepID=UPI00080E3013|nr:hypothetical protein [Aliivibrio fischeri]OCH08893.1 hypothetical protein A6E11_10830 [Aliivibrio fischeri]
MSNYFDDFPEENPKNGVGKQFNFELAQYFREQQESSDEATSGIITLEEASKALIEQEEREQRELKLEFLSRIEECPHCNETELNIYHFTRELFRYECQCCGIYGNGINEAEAYQAMLLAIEEGFDWRKHQVAL